MDTRQIDNAVRQGVDSGAIAGVVATAANEDGVFYERAFGKRRSGGSQDMTVDSVFWIASMTKAITTTAALQLVEQGRLSLHDPVSTICPELSAPAVLDGFDAEGKPILRPAQRPITLHHLLTHTAGFTYWVWDANQGRYASVADIPIVITCKRAALLMPPAFDPGERWEYGMNIDWVGQMIERVSGKTLEAYFQHHVFAPAGMSDTGFIMGARKERAVSMHARQPDGSLEATAFEMPQSPEFFMGGGGLYSTAPDYLKFTQMIMHDGAIHGRQLLRPETTAMMRANQIGDLEVRRLRTVEPTSSLDAEFFPGMKKKWSYGFMINEDAAPTGRSAGSLCWAGFGNTYYWIDPTRRVSGVIMMQTLPFADGPSLDAFERFETAIYAAMSFG